MEHQQISLDKCPVTGSDLYPQFSCEDYLVSHQKFEIKRNSDNSILITTPRPIDTHLGAFYESENYISHTDASGSVFDRAYQIIRNITLKRKVKLINKLNGAKGVLLDYGCGTGDFLGVAKKAGWEVRGIEPSEQARTIAEKKIQNEILLPESIKEIPDNSFGVITLWHVLEHVPDLMDTVDQLKRILKKDGHLILALPNYMSWDAKTYGAEWAAYDVPRHLWHFSKTGVQQLAEKAGMVKVDHLPMVFDAYYVCLLSNKQAHGRMRPIRSLMHGLLSNLHARRDGEWSSLIHVLRAK